MVSAKSVNHRHDLAMTSPCPSIWYWTWAQSILSWLTQSHSKYDAYAMGPVEATGHSSSVSTSLPQTLSHSRTSERSMTMTVVSSNSSPRRAYPQKMKRQSHRTSIAPSPLFSTTTLIPGVVNVTVPFFSPANAPQYAAATLRRRKSDADSRSGKRTNDDYESKRARIEARM